MLAHTTATDGQRRVAAALAGTAVDLRAGGQEDAVRDIRRRELEPLVDETWVDAAGNLVALVRGDRGDQAPRRERICHTCPGAHG